LEFNDFNRFNEELALVFKRLGLSYKIELNLYNKSVCKFSLFYSENIDPEIINIVDLTFNSAYAVRSKLSLYENLYDLAKGIYLVISFNGYDDNNDNNITYNINNNNNDNDKFV
jgi:hypothetical protein